MRSIPDQREEESLRRGPAGFTLLEVLIVVALLGLISIIATVSVSHAIQRQRLGVAAQQLAGFIENGFAKAQSAGGGVILTGVPNSDGSCTFSLYSDTNNNGVFDSGTDKLLSTQLLPNDTVVQGLTLGTYSSFGSALWPYTGSGSSIVLLLYCDSMGRTLNPTTSTIATSPQSPAGPNAQILAPMVLSLTHRFMLSGKLGPKVRYDVQVYPIWHATYTNRKY